MEDYIISWTDVWPYITILWWVHWNEICWIEVIEELKKSLKIKKWTVRLVYWNKLAIARWVRQIWANLNRIFLEDEELTENEKLTYEFERSKELKEIFNVSDYTLDIHSSSTIWSDPMIICEENAVDIVKYFPFEIICSGFDEVEPWSTEYYMNKIWKVWISLECWYHNDPGAWERWMMCVLSILRYFGMIDWEIKEYKQKRFRAYSRYLTKTEDFKIVRKFDDLEELRESELIWYDSTEPVYSSWKWYILFAKDRNLIWTEWFVELRSC